MNQKYIFQDEYFKAQVVVLSFQNAFLVSFHSLTNYNVSIHNFLSCFHCAPNLLPFKFFEEGAMHQDSKTVSKQDDSSLRFDSFEILITSLTSDLYTMVQPNSGFFLLESDFFLLLCALEFSRFST